jgi:hypothetical protein
VSVHERKSRCFQSYTWSLDVSSSKLQHFINYPDVPSISPGKRLDSSLPLTNMATIWKFEVNSVKFNVAGIYINVNCTQNEVTKLYK